MGEGTGDQRFRPASATLDRAGLIQHPEPTA
jgi:hypothetical protein